MKAFRVTVSNSEKFGLLANLRDVMEQWSVMFQCIIIPISSDSAAVIVDNDVNNTITFIINDIIKKFDDPITIEKLINI